MVAINYIVYLVASILITVWVGRSLNRNGRIFLVENFRGNEQLADSVNHLLLVGFYLINFGFISLALKYGDKPYTIEGGIEFLSTKIGLVIIILGAMHFFNMRALIKFRHFKWAANQEAAPVEVSHAA
jgi:hypothetical protein